MAPVEVVVDLERSLPSFVSDSAEWTLAVAVTQTRCGRRRMMQELAGLSELPLHPAANNQNQISLPSAAIPCLPLVSHPLDPRLLQESGRSGLFLCSSHHLLSNNHPVPRALRGVVLSSGEVSRSNPITVRTGGMCACCEMSEVVYSLPRANLIT